MYQDKAHANIHSLKTCLKIFDIISFVKEQTLGKIVLRQNEKKILYILKLSIDI